MMSLFLVVTGITTKLGQENTWDPFTKTTDFFKLIAYVIILVLVLITVSLSLPKLVDVYLDNRFKHRN